MLCFPVVEANTIDQAGDGPKLLELAALIAVISVLDICYKCQNAISFASSLYR